MTALASLTAFVASGNFHSTASSLSTALVVGSVCAGGFVFNDYKDWRIDSISAPNRPIPRQRFHRRAALWLAGLLFFLGLVVSSSQSPRHLAVVMAVTLLLILYSLGLKRVGLAANVLTAGISSSVFLYAGLAGVSKASLIPAALFVFLFIMARELVLDVLHAAGDAAGQRRTLPMIISPSATLWTSRIILMVASAGCIASTILLKEAGRPFAVASVVTLLLALFLFPSPQTPSLERFVVHSRWVLFIGILSLWLV